MADGSVDFLYTNIGRGHPFYLDGIVDALEPSRLGRVTDVFKLCRGVGGLAWRMARFAYRWGSSSGGGSAVYTRLRRRQDFNKPGVMRRLMGGPVVAACVDRPGRIVVAHPLLVAILGQHASLVYQHGEVAVPSEALVTGDHYVIVPDVAASEAFTRAGTPSARVIVSGLCIEPALVASADEAYDERRRRLDGLDPLTGAFFSSGAEPAAHIAILTAAAVAAVRAGGHVRIVAHHGGRYHSRSVRAFHRAGFPLVPVDPRGGPLASSPALLHTYRHRGELTAVTGPAMSGVDYFAAPPHERTLWALGLGVPMFIIDPPIGTYAPLNRARLLDAGVARMVDAASAETFGRNLLALRSEGLLAAMAEAGWGRYAIDGFRRIARRLEALEDAQHVVPKT